MRLILSLSLALTMLAGCHEAPEPMSEDIPRLGAGSAPAGRVAARPSEPPVRLPAEAQPARPTPPTPPQPAAEPAAPADVVEGDQRSPDEWVARLVTGEGNIDIEVHRAWAPHGADRFYTLVREGFFTDVAFFRVIDGFMAQGGIHGDPAVARRWQSRRIPDDPVDQSNRRGFVTFAMAGPNSRTTQFFINLVDNRRLDGMRFAPFGQVRDMTAVDALHSGYGEGAPRGQGPAQGRIQSEGNAYLRAEFPDLDYIQSASVLEG